MSLNQIERLAECDLTKSPPSNYPPYLARQPERVPSHIQLAGIEVGDIVRSLSVKHWEFRVIANVGEEFVTCDRIGANPPIKQTLHLSSIKLISKAAVCVFETRKEGDDVEEQARQALDSIQPPNPVFHAPIGERQARANWKAFQASRHTLDLKNGPIPMKSIEEWREMEREQRAFAALTDETEF